jgi:signal transduction histidine kinase
MIEPLLTDSLLTGDPTSVQRIDRVVRTRVLGKSIVRVKIWSRNGRVLYSDKPKLIGATYGLGADEIGILNGARVEADVSDLSKPENRFERRLGELVEVYMALRTPTGQPVLFETYLPSASIASERQRLLLQFLPVLLAALVLLWLTQLPLARRMGRRLKEGQQEREELLLRAIESSDRERRRVAHDLHDGVIQDLAGLSYELAAAADTAQGRGSSDLTKKLISASSATRRTIRNLRSLVIDVYPPDLHTMGLPTVLGDLASSIQARGVNVELDIPDDIELPTQTEALLFRVAQEGVRNALKHSGARKIRLELSKSDHRVGLTVSDNGRGFSKQELERQTEGGHMGLRLLDQLVTEAGGKLIMDSGADRGTSISAEMTLA